MVKTFDHFNFYAFDTLLSRDGWWAPIVGYDDPDFPEILIIMGSCEEGPDPGRIERTILYYMKGHLRHTALAFLSRDTLFHAVRSCTHTHINKHIPYINMRKNDTSPDDCRQRVRSAHNVIRFTSIGDDIILLFALLHQTNISHPRSSSSGSLDLSGGGSSPTSIRRTRSPSTTGGYSCAGLVREDLASFSMKIASRQFFYGFTDSYRCRHPQIGGTPKTRL